MPSCSSSGLRNHAHVLLIVPLIVIVMTWPTFARIFDGDEFWLHSPRFIDAGQKLWDAWHLERVLAGHTDYFHTDVMFHPHGTSLAFHASSAPHALLLLVLQKLIPVDDAYNLLYLLILCFNAFCTYVLIHHLLKDRWIALFGAVVLGVNVWFTDFVTSPDLLLIGTLPLTVYFLHRSLSENRWRFAALAGISAGITAFIGIYIFLFTLLTASIYCLFLSFSRWRRPAFWLQLLLFVGVCAPISAIRFYPMFVDAAVLNEALTRNFLMPQFSYDVLHFLVNSHNPVTADYLHSVFDASPDEDFQTAYLGYVNLLFLACALVHKPVRPAMAPWLVAMILFITLRLGDYLTYNTQAHTFIVLPGRALRELFPLFLGQVSNPKYFQIGVLTPLAVLSCLGLSVLLRSTPSRRRVSIILLSTMFLAVEYLNPRKGYVIEHEKTAYIAWLQAEDESRINLINLPRSGLNAVHYLYFQTQSGYPTAYGMANRGRQTTRKRYIDNNLLLRAWNIQQPVVCLPKHKSRSYLTALDELLREGFTHIVVHHWLGEAAALAPSFALVPAAYENGMVSVYRLADMRLNCQPPQMPAPLTRFLQSPWILQGFGSSVISYHPSQSINHDAFAYLHWLLSDWDNLFHVHLQDGEWMIQGASALIANEDASTQYGEVVYFTYDASQNAPTLPESVEFRDDFHLCQRVTHADSVVIELYLSERFSCSLIDSSNLLRVEYDQGHVIENLLYHADQQYFDLQIMWGDLPFEKHALSLQIFDREGVKIYGQDTVIGDSSLEHLRIDISSLRPGNYAVKLIVYNFKTRVSVPGTVIGTGTRFERELEIATIHRT